MQIQTKFYLTYDSKSTISIFFLRRKNYLGIFKCNKLIKHSYAFVGFFVSAIAWICKFAHLLSNHWPFWVQLGKGLPWAWWVEVTLYFLWRQVSKGISSPIYVPISLSLFSTYHEMPCELYKGHKLALWGMEL